ncbi:MAG: RimK/LysX family protein, partial [Desulfobacterota bacterium]|nr:RimK/LysX family protein [Thermodesulfobacteriota bacterium]
LVFTIVLIVFVGLPEICFVAFSEQKELKSSSSSKVIVGWLERVYLPREGFALKGKMDTGAKNSSIHAMEIEYLPNNSKVNSPRVRFKVIDIKKEYRIIEAELLGKAKIKRPKPSGESKVTIDLETRPMVELEICLAGITKRIPVNLTNRAGMNYPLILGRSALEGDFIVDVSKKFIYSSSSKCVKNEKQ